MINARRKRSYGIDAPYVSLSMTAGLLVCISLIVFARVFLCMNLGVNLSLCYIELTKINDPVAVTGLPLKNRPLITAR
jgi:hypothetical protein